MTHESTDTVAELANTLQAHTPELDDVRRARVLARMSPDLDALADRYAEHDAARNAANERSRRRWWLPIAGVAVAATVVGIWLGRGREPAPAPAVASDVQMLAPYVVSGAASEDVATTLLAGRFATLDVREHQLVRAVVDGDRAQRIALVGPSKLAVARGLPRDGDARTLELAAGTLIVDVRDPRRTVHVRAGDIDVRAHDVRFAVAIVDRTTVVFVDRGELVIAGRHVGAGQWHGPEATRSQALIAAVRDQANAVEPPEHGGVVAIAGTAPVVTEGGATIGTAPLWARMPEGDVVLVATDGSADRRAPVAIKDGAISHATVGVAVAPAAPTPSVPTPPSVPPPSVPAPNVATPPSVPQHVPTPPSVSPNVSPPSVPRTAHEPTTPSQHAPTNVARTNEPTAAELYTRAESALGKSDRAAAESLWKQLVQRYPHAPQAASALYDLAGLARARNDFSTAQSELAQLADLGEPAALREPSAYLRCRLHVDAGEPVVAATCFATFRAKFQSSAHDAEVLAWLIGYTQETSGCGAARVLADEYLHRYASGAFAARARECTTP